MKAREWSLYLEEQRRRHGKLLFTITELAHVARTSRRSLNVELSRLLEYGLIERYTRGIYGLPGIVFPEMLLPQLDSQAYITGEYALFHHHLIAQVPVRITCFTGRRHGKALLRPTPVGIFQFVSIKAPVYSPPRDGIIAEAEQAILDFVYLSRRSGSDPNGQVSFRNLDRLLLPRIQDLLSRYPQTVGRSIREILD